MNFAIVVYFEFFGGTLRAYSDVHRSPESSASPGFTDEDVELIYRGMDLSDLENRL